MKSYVLPRAMSLAELSARLGADARELARLNYIDRPGLLPPGLSLALPEKEARQRERELFCHMDSSGPVLPRAEAAERLSFVSKAFGAEEGKGEAAPWERDFCARVREAGALPVFSLTGLAEPHRLLRDAAGAEEYLAFLTERLAAAGWGGLNLAIGGLQPFEREAYNRLAALVSQLAHERGLWLFVTLPLFESRHSLKTENAAYDVAALARSAERLVLKAPLEDAPGLQRALEYFCGMAPSGKMLLMGCDGADTVAGAADSLSARQASQLAMSRGGRISRSRGGAARAEYSDADGAPCRLRWADAYYHACLSRLSENFLLAGEGFCPGSCAVNLSQPGCGPA